MAPKLPH